MPTGLYYNSVIYTFVYRSDASPEDMKDGPGPNDGLSKFGKVSVYVLYTYSHTCMYKHKHVCIICLVLINRR